MAYWRSDVPAGTLASVMQAAAGNLQMQAIADSEVGIPPGSFEGQLAVWDGTAWVPMPDNGGNPYGRTFGLRNVNYTEPDNTAQLILGDGTAQLVGSNRVQGAGGFGTIACGFIYSGEPGPGNAFWRSFYDDGDTQTQIEGTPTTITLTAVSTGGRITLLSHACSLEMEDWFEVNMGEGSSILRFDIVDGFKLTTGGFLNATFWTDGDEATAGFLGAAPVPKQSITGATTQTQVDSLVAALVAFGLVSDDR